MHVERLREVVVRLVLLLPLATGSTAGRSPAVPLGLSLELYNNSQALGSPHSTRVVAGASLDLGSLAGPLSIRLQGTWTPSQTGEHALTCGCAPADHLFVWVDDHMICDTRAWAGWQGPARGPAAIPLAAGKPVYIRAHLHRAASRPSVPVTLSLQRNTSGGVLRPVHPRELSPTVPALQARRMAMQRGLLRGWNCWWSTIGARPGFRGGMLAIALLPESFALTTVLCQLSTGACLSESTVAGTLTGPQRVRPGIKSLNGEYAELWAPAPGGLNVSIQWSAAAADDSLTVLISPLPNSTQHLNLSDYAVAMTGRFVCWNGEQGLCSAGEVSSDGTTLVGTAAGLRTVRAVASRPSIRADGLNVSMNEQAHPFVLVRLSQPVALCATAAARAAVALPCSVDVVTAKLAALRSEEVASYSKHIGGGKLSTAVEAMQSVLMWNTIWNPSEAGPWANVDRGWGQPYCMFAWDNLFASYMLSFQPGSRDLAISNLIQIVKSRVMAGFVPGYSKGIEKTRDKTEPPIGSKILLEIYLRYREDALWLVELLFDDLFGWHSWFMRRRILRPLGLVCLGSDPINTTAGAGDSRVDPNDWNINQMQGARYESGQDDSPLYDEGSDPLFNASSHHMEIYDVGFSSMFVMEARALAELALALNRTAARATLLERAAAMQGLIGKHLWDASRSVFANRFLKNDTLSAKIGPTSFYPLQAGTATVAQAEAMVSGWLSNRSRFCVSEDWPFKGAAPVRIGLNGTDISCFWGLPSISADDEEYCNGNQGHCGYWRGHTWGPLAMLTYWGLRDPKYKGSVVVTKARKALVRQMREMLGAVWRAEHHVCENYSPWRQQGAPSCTGDPFYTWGGLNGLMSFLEAEQEAKEHGLDDSNF